MPSSTADLQERKNRQGPGTWVHPGKGSRTAENFGLRSQVENESAPWLKLGRSRGCDPE